MADAMRSNPLGTRDPFVTNLVISDETNAQVVPPHCDSSEVVLADEVDRPFDGIHPKGTASLKGSAKGLDERSQFRILSAKVVINSAGAARVCLLRLGEPPAAEQTRPQGLTSQIPVFGHLSSLWCPANVQGSLRGFAAAEQ
jgi:hypothetical protein